MCMPTGQKRGFPPPWTGCYTACPIRSSISRSIQLPARAAAQSSELCQACGAALRCAVLCSPPHHPRQCFLLVGEELRGHLRVRVQQLTRPGLVEHLCSQGGPVEFCYIECDELSRNGRPVVVI